MDLRSWTTGASFRGVKMIPPGCHLVCAAATGSQGDVAPRSGFFVHLRAGEVHVRKWDPETEAFAPIGAIDEDQRERLALGEAGRDASRVMRCRREKHAI